MPPLLLPPTAALTIPPPLCLTTTTTATTTITHTLHPSQANSDADLDNVDEDISRDGLIEGLLKLAWTSAVSLTTLIFNFIIKRVVTKVTSP